MEMYPKCFNGIVGCFDDYTYHITLEPEVPPVVHAPRRVPIQLKDKLQAEMESQDIIARVTRPTDWVNSLVIREKENGRLRLCLNHHPIPILEQITPKLTGAKLFSKLDARNGYWNVKLDEESSYLTTFNTPFGRYRFLRMPFGLRMSQDIFQFKIDETYRDCQGAIGIADDVTVYGKNEKEHDLHLHETMERTKKAGIKLNDEKCVIKTKECNFFGMLYTPDGDHTAPLRNLLKENVDFAWNPSHSKAFEKVKLLICTATTLAYYDEKKPVAFHVDASSKGLGAALFQDNKPIAFASKALTPAETRYANIERELLAEETAKDETLQLFSRKVIQGWPDSVKKIDPEVKAYWPLRDDISVEDGLVFLGSRVIVPESLRGNILQQIHGGHLGMEKCKLRAKFCVYWPDIYKEIENLVNSCCMCQKYNTSQQKEPMIPSEIPSRPWQTVSADLFYVQQAWFLVIANYYSKFPFVKKLHNLTARAVVNEMKMLFAENGIPRSLQCDNGTQFTSGEFQQLASQFGFEIVTSSPYYPRGHGFVER